MLKIVMTIAAVLALSAVAGAQSPAPSGAPAAGSDAGEATSAQPAEAAQQNKPPSGDFANDQTYRTKDGGMYQPPAQRPVSPALDLRSGRT